MNYEVNGLKEHFKNLSDDALRRIIYIEFQEYENDVIEHAKAELKSRYAQDIWEGSGITLKDVILQTNREDLKDLIHAKYPELIIDIERYLSVFDKLLTLEPMKQSEIDISIQQNEDKGYCVIGQDRTAGERVEISYCSWDEWLGFVIDNKQLQHLGKEEFTFHCFKAMTLLGFDEGIAQQELQKIEEGIEYTSEAGEIEGQPSFQIENEVTIDKIAERGKQIKEELQYSDVFGVRPWIRYWARGIDMLLWTFFIWIIELAFIPYQTIKWVNSLAWGMVSNFIVFSLWTFVEALFLSRWGFTPGKWILYTEVTNVSGYKLAYKAAFKRVWNVFVYGEGFQIPIISVITQIVCFNKLKEQGKTRWDREGGFRVMHRKIEPAKVLLAVLILAGLPFLMYYISRLVLTAKVN